MPFSGLARGERCFKLYTSFCLPYRYSKYSKYDISIKDKDAINKFTDTKEISDFAETEMEWAVSKQVMKGSDVNTLMPLKDISRSEICSLLYNYIGIYNID